MSERFKKVGKPLAVAGVAIALAAGAGGAKAAPESPVKAVGIESVYPKGLMPMDEVNRQANEALKIDNGPQGFWYDGWAKIVGPDGKIKGTIYNPIIFYRGGGANAKDERAGFNHPGSEHWAYGYLFPGVGTSSEATEKARAEGQDQRIIMLPHSEHGNKVLFYPRHTEPGSVLIRTFNFPQGKHGNNVAMPTDGFGKSLKQDNGLYPETIGLFENT